MVASDARDVATATHLYTEAAARLDALEADARREQNAADLARLSQRSAEIQATLREAAFRLTAVWSDLTTVEHAMHDLGGPEPAHEHLIDHLAAIGIDISKPVPVPATMMPDAAFSSTPDGWSPLQGMGAKLPA